VTTSRNGSALIGLVAGAFALLLGLAMLAVGIAWAAGAFGDKPNWLVAGLCLVLGVVALLTGLAGLSFGWRSYRS
jgi:uncharacterized membrane protein YcjF (UPF0283 family)